MSTVSREIMLKTLRGNGCYPGDPQSYSLWTYHNQFTGGVSYKVCEHDAMERGFLASEAVTNPILLWTQEGGVTMAGRRLLQEEDA